jgi:transcriptional regulator with XRE-family HTH domain
VTPKKNLGNPHLARKILILRRRKKLSQEELGEAVGVSGVQIGYYEKGKNQVPDEVLRGLSKALELSVRDLMDDKLDLELTGEGISTSSAKEERDKYRRAGMIPLYDTVAVGGSEFLKADDAAVTINNFEWIHAGPFVGRATGAIRHYGDSMYEKYTAGAILAYADAVHWRELIHYGTDYVIETIDGYRVTKNVQPDKEGSILAVSYNAYKNKHGIEIYRPYSIPLKMIRMMSYVLGMVRFEASMQPFAVVEEQNK